ncbi:hypothetical protein [Demequina pelophila]|uniref:hypothetical protein n=1 Tax=Demequina pelophila TaxID=1638984 RepID=UPI0007812DD4|nr:hypothetical protein [Demequina pelophila]
MSTSTPEPDGRPAGPGREPSPEPGAEPGAAPTAQPTEEMAPIEHSPAPASSPVATHVAPSPSVLERVRENRMGALAAALFVALAVALLLAVLVPDEPNLFASVLLGLLLTAAVGFTVRVTSRSRGLLAQATAFVATVVGVHVLAVTGAIDGLGPAGLLERVGLSGPGYDDALLAALATPAVSAGGVLAGLVAAIVAGWGRRDPGEPLL